MWIFGTLKVSSKLAILAGVPVLGALLLALLIARDAEREVQAAQSLGSIEDLASLTERMANVVHALQTERAQLSYSVGVARLDDPDIAKRTQETDQALGSLESFLKQRDAKRLPARLREDLWAARDKLTRLRDHRSGFLQADSSIAQDLEFYSSANDSLIRATAALTQISSDEQLALSIVRLTGAMQVIERSSREHALLSYVLAKKEFPPGTFRDFVTLLTEEEAYGSMIRTLDGQAAFTRFQAVLKGPLAAKIAEMRAAALDASAETLDGDAGEWFRTQNANLAELFRFERGLAAGVRDAAAKKAGDVRAAVRLSLLLAASVLGVSGLLAWAVARGLTRSLRALSESAQEVHQHQNFAVRAQKTSDDELGLLTDAFNAMLSGLEERDHELNRHRENLEELVALRTRELSERNEQMRLVLDNVDQGLVMVDREGKLLPECSRAFSEAFGAPPRAAPFSSFLAPDDENARMGLALGYEQLIDGMLPTEVALDQLPTDLVRGERHYKLSFRPTLREHGVEGALLVVRDVTEELAARKLEAARSEQLWAFERIMRDASGFREFLRESRTLLERLRLGKFEDVAEKMRIVHTLKGTAAMFDVQSTAEAAHELERALLEKRDETQPLMHLFSGWNDFIARVAPVLGEERRAEIELSQAELQRLVTLIRGRADQRTIEQFLHTLQWESARVRCERIREQLSKLSQRLGKGIPEVEIEAEDVRIPVRPLRGFWSAFSHVLRNLVDHGMQTEEQRRSQGKPAQNCVKLCIVSTPAAFCVEIADDGRGMDWNKLRERAAEHGVPHQTRADLVRALFGGGISTSDTVTLHSGRGVGMSAVLSASRSLNGDVHVESEPGMGTRLRFVFPPAIKLDSLPLEEPDAESELPLSVPLS